MNTYLLQSHIIESNHTMLYTYKDCIYSINNNKLYKYKTPMMELEVIDIPDITPEDTDITIELEINDMYHGEKNIMISFTKNNITNYIFYNGEEIINVTKISNDDLGYSEYYESYGKLMYINNNDTINISFYEEYDKWLKYKKSDMNTFEFCINHDYSEYADPDNTKIDLSGFYYIGAVVGHPEIVHTRASNTIFISFDSGVNWYNTNLNIDGNIAGVIYKIDNYVYITLNADNYFPEYFIYKGEEIDEFGCTDVGYATSEEYGYKYIGDMVSNKDLLGITDYNYGKCVSGTPDFKSITDCNYNIKIVNGNSLLDLTIPDDIAADYNANKSKYKFRNFKKDQYILYKSEAVGDIYITIYNKDFEPIQNHVILESFYNKLFEVRLIKIGLSEDYNAFTISDQNSEYVTPDFNNFFKTVGFVPYTLGYYGLCEGLYSLSDDHIIITHSQGYDTTDIMYWTAYTYPIYINLLNTVNGLTNIQNNLKTISTNKSLTTQMNLSNMLNIINNDLVKKYGNATVHDIIIDNGFINENSDQKFPENKGRLLIHGLTIKEGTNVQEYTGECEAENPNGKTWTKSSLTNIVFNNLYSINGVWIASHNTATYYSIDKGKTWTKSNANITKVYKKDGMFVGCSTAGLYYSADGKTWTKSNVTSGTFNYCYSNGSKWIACGTGLYYSVDGKTWTKSNITSGTFNYCYYTLSNWFAFSTAGLYHSIDGKTWTKGNVTSGNFYNCCFANGTWVACTNAGLYYCEINTTWIKSNITSGTFNKCCFGFGKYIACGTGIYYSTDGKTWTKSNITSGTFYHCHYANGILIAAGSTGLYYSEDGITWTISNITTDSKNCYYGNDGAWVACNSTGLLYSLS